MLNYLSSDNKALERQDVSKRTFDTCFEMNDGEIVVKQIMLADKENRSIVDGIREKFREYCLLHWQQYNTSLGRAAANPQRDCTHENQSCI